MRRWVERGVIFLIVLGAALFWHVFANGTGTYIGTAVTILVLGGAWSIYSDISEQKHDTIESTSETQEEEDDS